jgi:hypothetical protein
MRGTVGWRWTIVMRPSMGGVHALTGVALGSAGMGRADQPANTKPAAEGSGPGFIVRVVPAKPGVRRTHHEARERSQVHNLNLRHVNAGRAAERARPEWVTRLGQTPG